VASFFKCVVTEVVLFLIVALETHFTRLCSDTRELYWDL